MESRCRYANDMRALTQASQREDIAGQTLKKTVTTTEHLTTSSSVEHVNNNNNNNPGEGFIAPGNSQENTAERSDCYGGETSFHINVIIPSNQSDSLDNLQNRFYQDRTKINAKESNGYSTQISSAQGVGSSFSSSELPVAVKSVETLSPVIVKTEKHQPCSSSLKRMLKRKIDGTNKSTSSQKSSVKPIVPKIETSTSNKSESGLTSSLDSPHMLYDILNEKKMALMKSPEVVKFLQQRQVAKTSELRYKQSNNSADR